MGSKSSKYHFPPKSPVAHMIPCSFIWAKESLMLAGPTSSNILSKRSSVSKVLLVSVMMASYPIRRRAASFSVLWFLIDPTTLRAGYWAFIRRKKAMATPLAAARTKTVSVGLIWRFCIEPKAV